MKKIMWNIFIVSLVFVISGVAWSKSPKKTVSPREGSIVISDFKVFPDCIGENYQGTVTLSGTIECLSHPEEPIQATLDSGGVLEIEEFKANRGKGKGRVTKRAKGKGRVPRIVIPPNKGGGYTFSYEAEVCEDLGSRQYDITLTAVGKRSRTEASATVELTIGKCGAPTSNIPDVIPIPY